MDVGLVESESDGLPKELLLDKSLSCREIQSISRMHTTKHSVAKTLPVGGDRGMVTKLRSHSKMFQSSI